jgi:hypothetical protein
MRNAIPQHRDLLVGEYAHRRARLTEFFADSLAEQGSQLFASHDEISNADSCRRAASSILCGGADCAANGPQRLVRGRDARHDPARALVVSSENRAARRKA